MTVAAGFPACTAAFQYITTSTVSQYISRFVKISASCTFQQIIYTMLSPTSILILQSVFMVLSVSSCPLGKPSDCKDWQLALDHVQPSGTVVHGHANIPLNQSPTVQGNVHGSHVFGGPYNGAQTVGGGLKFEHSNGLHGGVDATHTRGVGNTYSATVGGSTQLGPGTLTVGGGANTLPGSSKIEGQVGATYTVPLD